MEKFKFIVDVMINGPMERMESFVHEEFLFFKEYGMQDRDEWCPSSYKMGHQSGLSLGGSGSSLGLIMQPAFDVASGDIGLSVS